MNDPAMLSRLRWYRLLPIAFVVHDSEELLTLPGWVAHNHSQLTSLLQRIGVSEGALDVLPTTHAKAAGAIAVLFTGFLLVSEGAWRAQGRGAWQVAFVVLLGGFFLHGFTHLAQAVYFGGYTPGVVTAGTVVIPVSLYLYWRLHLAGLFRPGLAIASAVLGLALVLPGVLLAMLAGAAMTAR